ncbi:MAG: DUF4167 domain-containing protein [Aquamicrobium sp.]|nr:DUF4167 domain-containing protein [Aquamicrobium sp.]
MRPQQNRRMRGRGGNGNNPNRKGPNPLTRSYESNGPDVKIRGSAQQIAEKYTTLARDAQSAGDRVIAENYLQHAEHYNRIIMAAQENMPQQQMRNQRDEDDEDEEGNGSSANEQPTQPHQHNQQQNHNQNRNNGSGPQPVIEGVPAEVALKQGGGSEASAEAAPEGETKGEEASAEAAPRKPRRPRRPRVKAGEEGAPNGDQPAGSDEPVTEAAQ